MDGAPRYVPINLCDRIVGLFVVNAITAALYHRAMTGEGQQIEVPMFETMSQFVLADHISGGAFEPPLTPLRYKRLMSTSRGPYLTKDGALAVVVYGDKHWVNFQKIVGGPDLLKTDPRFRDQESRTVFAQEVGDYLAGQIRLRTTAEWLEVLGPVDIPACPVNHIEDLPNDPHLKAVGLFDTLEHPTEGMIKVPRHPVRYSKTPAQVRRHAPNLGEHNDAFLKE